MMNLWRITKIILVILLLNSEKLISNSAYRLDDKNSQEVFIDKDLQVFLKENNFKRLFFVFAGPYPASPTSSFGHTFLLLEPNEDRPFLLWNTIDFSATNTGVGSIEFFIKGIFGGILGEYRMTSFFEKFREYTFIESRPLWLFPFEINKDEKNKFLINLFSLMGKKNPYFFRNKNCASQIDSLLQITVNGSYSSEKQFFFPLTLLNNWKERISSPIFIESMNNIIAENISETFVKNEFEIDSLNSPESASLLNYLEWKYKNEDKHLTPLESSILKKLRVHISSSENNSFNNFKKYKKEFYLHPSTLVSSGMKLRNNSHYEYMLQYRFGLHEFFENTSVYPRNDYLEIFKIKLSFSKTKMNLDKILLFNQLSLQPISQLSGYFSWKIGFGSERKFEIINSPLATGLFTGIGYTFELQKNKFNVSLLMEVSPVYLEKSGFSILLGPELLTYIELSNRIKIMNRSKANFNYRTNMNLTFLHETNLSYELTNYLSTIFQYYYSSNNTWYTIELNYYID